MEIEAHPRDAEKQIAAIMAMGDSNSLAERPLGGATASAIASVVRTPFESFGLDQQDEGLFTNRSGQIQYCLELPRRWCLTWSAASPLGTVEVRHANSSLPAREIIRPR